MYTFNSPNLAKAEKAGLLILIGLFKYFSNLPIYNAYNVHTDRCELLRL